MTVPQKQRRDAPNKASTVKNAFNGGEYGNGCVKQAKVVESEAQLCSILLTLLQMYPDGLSLSNIKAAIREAFGLDLVQSLLGHGTMLQLMQSPTVLAVCSLKSEGLVGHLHHKVHKSEWVVSEGGISRQSTTDSTTKATGEIGLGETKSIPLGQSGPRQPNRPATRSAANKTTRKNPSRSLHSIVRSFPPPTTPENGGKFCEDERIACAIQMLSSWHAHAKIPNTLPDGAMLSL